MLSAPRHHRLTLNLWFQPVTAYGAALFKQIDAVGGNAALHYFLPPLWRLFLLWPQIKQGYPHGQLLRMGSVSHNGLVR